MQEMPPHVTLPVSGPVLEHLNKEGEEHSRTALKSNYLQITSAKIRNIVEMLVREATGRGGHLQEVPSIVIWLKGLRYSVSWTSGRMWIM